MAWSDAARRAALEARRRRMGYHGTSAVVSGRLKGAAGQKGAYAAFSVRKALMYARLSSSMTGKPARLYRVAVPTRSSGAEFAPRLREFRNRRGLSIVGPSIKLLR